MSDSEECSHSVPGGIPQAFVAGAALFCTAINNFEVKIKYAAYSNLEGNSYDEKERTTLLTGLLQGGCLLVQQNTKTKIHWKHLHISGGFDFLKQL